MLTSRRGSGSALPAVKAPFLIGTLFAASVALSAAHAAGFGHSRLMSAPGQPLHLEIPVTELTQPEIESLRATPAPAAAWQAAGMTPPVPLDSMRLVLLDGYRPGVKVIQLRSDQVSGQPIVDVLLDIRSASGQQRYQVSLLAHADPQAVQRAGGESARHPRVIDGRGEAAMPGSHAAAGTQIHVRTGDNMFAIAQRNAVQGVSVYQMMIALQRANSHAFIQDNVNLVRAGATLTMPDIDTLTALSDREARRIFQQHAQAFARYRQRSSGGDVAAVSTTGAAVAQGSVTESPASAAHEQAVPAAGGDRLRLSGGPQAGAAAPSGPAASTASNEPGQAPGQGGSAAGGPGTGAASAEASMPGIAAGSAAAGSNGTVNAPSASNGPSVSLLASSGAIATDATHDHPAARQAAASEPRHPDDEAALHKGIDESRTRIIELEDNVRHLNEALQKQGHVAAEAALEGARSVTEAIKEAIGLIDDDPADGASVVPDSTADTSSASSETSSSETPAADAAGSTPAVGQGGTPEGPDAAATAGSGSGPASATGGAPGSVGGSPATDVPGSVPGATGQAAGTTGGVAGASGQAAAPSGQAAVPSGQAAAPSGQAAAPSGQAAAPSGQGTTSPAESQKKESWFQQNLLAVIGGGLLLVVLIVAWVLRRIGASERNAFESDSPITDSMVREKLRDIDLELDQSPSGRGGRGGS